MMNNYIGGKIIIGPEYTEQVLPEYQNNPLIECLPPILSKQEVIDMMFFRPEVPSDIQNIPPEVRFHLINRIKSAYFPGPEIIEIERNVSSMLRNGYILRNPLNMRKNFGVLNVLDNILEIKGPNQFFDSQFCNYSDNDEATCMTYNVIGLPGMGKTTLIKKIMSTYPSILAHKEYKGKNLSLIQIPILKMECSSNGLKGFCLNFFSALDMRLKNTNYARQYGQSRLSQDYMLKQIEILSAQHHIGLLVVDEIQHLASAGSESAKIMNFFVSMTNVIHIPILFVGTPSAHKVFGQQLRISRRVGTEGGYDWDRMPYYNEDGEPDRKWNSFLKFLWRLQYLNEYVEFNEEFSKLMYRYSQGITAIAVALFILTQRHALEREERITPELIKEVADKHLKAVKPMIDALASGNKEEIKKYQDIKISLDALVGSTPKADECIIANNFNQVVNGSSAKEEKPQRKSRNVKPIAIRDPKDLRYIFQQAQHNKIDLDVAFKEAGYLRELGE